MLKPAKLIPSMQYQCKRVYRWLRGTNHPESPLDGGQPWLSPPAIQLLQTIVQPGMEVFEYGAGGSTVFFARRVARVFSVEHDPFWFQAVSERLQKLGLKNWDWQLIELKNAITPAQNDPSNWKHYATSKSEYADRDFRWYVCSIDSYPDNRFDLILIDGRARPACLRHALAKVKPGGWIILDNSERERYWPAMALMPKTFSRIDRSGLTGGIDFEQTTFWRRDA